MLIVFKILHFYIDASIAYLILKQMKDNLRLGSFFR